MYDEYGMEGIKSNMSSGGMDGSDIFSQFFGGGRANSNRRRRTEDIVRDYPVEMKDLYCGKTAKFRITHKIICPTCRGKGGDDGCERDCSDCRGQGMRVRILQRGNVIQQSRSPCTTCNGTGKIIDPTKRCKNCNGNKVVSETKTIEVDVEPGMKEGDKVILPSAADEAPNAEAGDVIYVIQEKSNSKFSRKGADLLHYEQISLGEALCGFKRVLEHLDGHKIVIESKPGKVSTPDTMLKIPGEGMPVRGSPFNHGNLFVRFNIKFPSSMTMGDIVSIKSVLPFTEPPVDDKIPVPDMLPARESEFGLTPSSSVREDNVGVMWCGDV